MTKVYYDLNHASMRLRGTVVSLDDRYVLVEDVGVGPKQGEYTIVYKPLLDINSRAHGFLPTQKVRSDNLNLGFVNSKPGKQPSYAVYTSRIPHRAWKEGLTHQNVEACTTDGATLRNAACAQLVASKDIVKTFLGQYPGYEECLKLVESSFSAAFGRNFAINTNKELIFRDKGVVGLANKDPQLKDKFFYLKELLQQELH